MANGLRHAVSAFFKADVALKRADDGVRIVLRERAPKLPKVPTREELAAKREKEELALALQQLGDLLDEVPGTREAMRHLVFVEHALAKKGLRALHKLPLEVLERALEQLEGLVTNWSPAGLASLRSKMAVAIIDREHMDPDAEADAYRTAAVLDTLPDDRPAVEPQATSDDDALAAAYAALGNLIPSDEVEMQGELASPSARALQREITRPLARAVSAPDSIQLRELQH
jgi:hypothetical protein